MSKDGKAEGLTCIEAGALGGRKVLALYGREHYQRAGRKGQAEFRKRYTREDRRRFGSMGGRPKKWHYMGEGANLNDRRKGKPARSSSPLPPLQYSRAG